MFQWIVGIPALIGVGGIAAFGPRGSSLADALPARVAGDGTHKYLDAIGIVLQVGGTIWLMDLYSRWGYEHGLPFTHGLESWIQWFLVIGIVVVLHESAHALVGVALGMKLRAFIVGPFQFRIHDGRWEFAFHPTHILAFSGAAGLTAVNPDESRWNEVAMVAAGPFINLLTGAVAAALAYSADQAPWWFLWEYCALFATVSFVAGIVNLVPLRPDGLYSDGARILQLFRNSPAADFHGAVKTVTATLVSSRSAKDFDIAAIERASAHFTTGEQALLLHLWAMDHYEQAGNPAKALAALAEAERIYLESASDISASLHTTFVISCVLLRRDPVATRQWWERMQTKKLERRNADYWLAKCCFHWAEDDIVSARETWTIGNVLVQQLPNAGAYNFDRDRYRMMREVLDTASTGQVTLEPADAMSEVHARYS